MSHPKTRLKCPLAQNKWVRYTQRQDESKAIRMIHSLIGGVVANKDKGAGAKPPW